MTSNISSFLPAHLLSLEPMERQRIEQVLEEFMPQILAHEFIGKENSPFDSVEDIYTEFILDMLDGTDETRDMVMKLYTEKLNADLGEPNADRMLYLRALIATDTARGRDKYLLGTQFLKYQANKAVAAQGFIPPYPNFWTTADN